MRRAVVYAIICCFGAAALAQEKSQLKVPTPNDGTVYLYRVKERRVLAVGGKSAYVYLNDKKVLSMTESRFVGLRLPPGRYILKLKTEATETPITVEVGKTYFFRVSKTVQGGYVHDLVKTDAEQAVHQMRDLTPLEDKNVTDKTLQTVKDKPNDN